jgi:hypothetical protein
MVRDGGELQLVAGLALILYYPDRGQIARCNKTFDRPVFCSCTINGLVSAGVPTDQLETLSRNARTALVRRPPRKSQSTSLYFSMWRGAATQKNRWNRQKPW